MGTNYYLKRIPTEEEIQKTHRLLDEGKIESHSCYFYYDPERDCSVQDMIKEMTREIHLGKNSYGWQFCCRANKEYGKSYEELYDFVAKAIASGNWELLDEYGDRLTYADFHKMVESKKGQLTFQTDPHKNEYYKYIKDTDSISEDGSWWCDNEFC